MVIRPGTSSLLGLLLVTACSGGVVAPALDGGQDSALPGKGGPEAGTPDGSYADAGGPDGNDTDAEGPDAGDASLDSDGDGLSDADEAALGTDPADRDSDGDGVPDGDEVRAGSDPLDADSDDDGFTDGEELYLGTDPNGGDVGAEGCASREAAASETTRPVDVIVIVDNSSSMDGEIAAIQARINEDFGDVLDMAGVDWRVVMISRHGAIGHDINGCDDNGICIQGDLVGTASCDPDAAPPESNRFKQYSVCINSRDGLAKAASSFDTSPPAWGGGFKPSQYFDASESAQAITTAPTGWQSLLRPGALRAFLMISDDESDVIAQQFTDWMYSKDPSFFGTVQNPNWMFHSIIAVEAKPDPAEPWTSDEPIISQDCGKGSAAIGYDYQDLSIASGGLRFPICENDNFDAVFQAVAQRVVESSTVPCVLTPAPVVGSGSADYDRVTVIYSGGDGARNALRRAANMGACDDGDWYLDGASAVALCPMMCSNVASDPGAQVHLRVACSAVCGNNVREGDEECDDGNTDAGDFCGPHCTVEDLCGNSQANLEEECDDGNRTPGDGCGANCNLEVGCGDGTLESFEECDDDNLEDGDGCSATCQVEVGCGDGIVQAGEQCDDDNLEDGDGCSALCTTEVI